MAKDPAFLFYPGDWQGGTQHMTFEEKGAYLELLILQFNRGPFSEAYAKRVLSTSFASVWQVLREKFTENNGLYYNEKLKTEKERRQKFTESRRKNAKSAKNNVKTEESNPLNQSSTSKAYALHMETETENAIESINSNKVPEIFETAFESFWNAYGHKVKRALAEREFVEQIKSGAEPLSIARAAAEYSAYCTKTGRKKQDAKNWLSEKAYQTDWLEVAKSDSSGTAKSQKAATRQTAFEIINTINDEGNDG